MIINDHKCSGSTAVGNSTLLVSSWLGFGSDCLLQLEDLNKIDSSKDRKQINYETIIRVSSISKKDTRYGICYEVLNSACMSNKYMQKEMMHIQTAGPLKPSLKIEVTNGSLKFKHV